MDDNRIDSGKSNSGTGNSGLDILQYGKGVCGAYTDAFQTMTSMLGIGSCYLHSLSLNHAWNAVIIDDKIYYVDVTWNDSLNSDNYLMAAELWDDHMATDIAAGSIDISMEFVGWY